MSQFAVGVWPAALTPYNDDLSIDDGAYHAHLDWLFAQGADGVAVLGTTGEANSLSLEERRELIGKLRQKNIAPERVVIGVGCTAAGDTLSLTRAAIDAGYPRVMMLPPFYYKNVSDDGLFAAYARIVEQVREPALKVLIYDIPSMVGFALSTDLLIRLRQAFPGVVVGVKNSSNNWPAMEDAFLRMPGFEVFAGSEQYLVPSLRAGGPGCISAVANVTIAELAALMRNWRAENADALQDAATQKRIALQKFPTIPALKHLTAQRTGNPRWRLTRPPLVALDSARGAELDALVREMHIGSS